jgi:hypothetical protein
MISTFKSNQSIRSDLALKIIHTISNGTLKNLFDKRPVIYSRDSS